MSDYIFGSGLTVRFEARSCGFSVTTRGGESWRWAEPPYLVFSDGKRFAFSDADFCRAEEYSAGASRGVRVEYRGFGGFDLSVFLYVLQPDGEDELYFDVRVEGDGFRQLLRLCCPAALDFSAAPGGGYTVLPRMQGTLVPAGDSIKLANGRIQERDGYMSFFGQVRGAVGYIAIYDTPYDAHYAFERDRVQPYFIASLGTIRYKRRMIYRFFDSCDYVSLAKAYRGYMLRTGKFVSLTEKIARNPNVEKLIGAPIIHEGIAVHISPESKYYIPGKPEHNDSFVSFETRSHQLRALKARGLDRAYLHLDGWGAHGYDNLHPDPLPPNAAAGGAEGMKALSDACRGLGYMFGIHDQYRDLYHDAPTYSPDNCVLKADGTRDTFSVWYGGAQSFLCARLAPDYVRRNYADFERLGIVIDGSYLDVFSVVELDECLSPDHEMSREQCAGFRRECLDYLTSKGIIVSSEETIDSILPSIALCHHSPYYTDPLGEPDAGAAGIPVPLFNLVYHDAIVIPWFGLPGQLGGWGMPKEDSGYLHALLNGGTAYCPIEATKKDLSDIQVILDNHVRVAKCEMLSHEFVNGNLRCQRTTFSDGTSVEVDFDEKTYRIS